MSGTCVMPQIKYCWDTTVLIAILTREQRASDEITAMLEVVDAADAGKAIIISSVTLKSEVLNSDRFPTLRGDLDDLFSRPNYVMYDVTPGISDIVADVRESARRDGRRIKTPDATFIATAIAHRVAALHTFDEQLLGLNGSAHIQGLEICHPRGVQTVLGL
jgi:predicted nucleic acid-binding protein